MTAANAATLSGKLTQMVNGAVYSDAGGIEFIHDKKLDALEDIIEAANGKSILVAYWYKHDLTRIIDSTTGAHDVRWTLALRRPERRPIAGRGG